MKTFSYFWKSFNYNENGEYKIFNWSCMYIKEQQIYISSASDITEEKRYESESKKYEEAFQAIPILVSFIPMLMSTGGNCGSQSSTTVIRGLATGEIQFKDFFKAVFKEFRISLIISVILAVTNGLRIFIFYKNLQLSIVITLSIIGTVIIAEFIGCALPLIAKKVKLDPAIMATPLISTIVDTCSMLIYFQFATMIFSELRH